MKHISCSACRARFDELLAQSTFNAETPAALTRAHLEECADCRREFELQKAAQLELQHLPRVAAPPNLRAAVREQLTAKSRRAGWLEALTRMFHAPQRLVWAGSSLAVLLLIAFLMRPERQQELLAPHINRAQIESQAQRQERTRAEPPAQSAAPHAEKRQNQSQSAVTPPPPSPNDAPRRTQKPVFQAPKPTQKPLRESKPPAPPARETPETTQPAPPLAKSAPTAPAMTPETPSAASSAPAIALQKNGDDVAPASEPGIARPSPARESTAPAAEGEGPPAAPPMARMRALPAPPARPAQLRWQQEIVAPVDVAQAIIYAEPLAGVSFADNSESREKRRMVWQGELRAGQRVTVAIDLHLADTSGKIRLEIEDASTQKVLLSEPFSVAGHD